MEYGWNIDGFNGKRTSQAWHVCRIWMAQMWTCMEYVWNTYGTCMEYNIVWNMYGTSWNVYELNVDHAWYGYGICKQALNMHRKWVAQVLIMHGTQLEYVRNMSGSWVDVQYAWRVNWTCLEHAYLVQGQHWPNRCVVCVSFLHPRSEVIYSHPTVEGIMLETSKNTHRM